MALKKHIEVAAKAVGGAKANDIWTLHNGGVDIKQAFIDACGFTNLEDAAVTAEAEAAKAQAAERVADKEDKPEAAAEAVKAKAKAKTAREAADNAKKETEEFLQALKAAELSDAPPDPAEEAAKAAKEADEEAKKGSEAAEKAATEAKKAAKDDLEAIEEIAKDFSGKVAAYKAAVIRETGRDPEDDPDQLTEDVKAALSDAKSTHAALLTESNLLMIIGQAVIIANARTKAIAAQADLSERTSKIAEEETISAARKEAAEKSRSFKIKGWLKARWVPYGALAVAVALLIISMIVGLPKWSPTWLIGTMFALAILAVALWAAKPVHKEDGSPSGMVGSILLAIVSVGLLILAIRFGGNGGSEPSKPESGLVHGPDNDITVLQGGTPAMMWVLMGAIVVLLLGLSIGAVLFWRSQRQTTSP